MDSSVGRIVRVGRHGSLAHTSIRLLLVTGVAGVVWLPWAPDALRASGRLWAAALLGLMLVMVLALFPLPGEGVLVRASRPTRMAAAFALLIASGAVVAMTGGWQSPLAFLYLIPALSLDAAPGGTAVAATAAAVFMTDTAAGVVAGHTATGPMVAGTLVARAGVWAALAATLLALRAAWAWRSEEWHHLRRLAHHQEAQALALERARGELLAHVSHELVTPLAAIRAGSGMLAEILPTTDQEGMQVTQSATYHRLALNVHRNATRLTLLVDDLLELARLEEGRSVLRPEWHPCAQVVQRAIEAVGVLAEGRQQELSWSVAVEDLSIWGDARRIEQVLVNLLANAYKYAGEGAHIALTARPERQGVAFEVCDDGPGLGPEVVAQVFDRYYRGPGVPGQGSGLGLAIAGALAELHHGSIWVEDNTGAGCRFIFWLPNPAATCAPCVASSAEDEA